jgi:integrator complex subunit 11
MTHIVPDSYLILIQGGKVLIPVFALGRAQELCILVETYWERMNLNVPVYFSAGWVLFFTYFSRNLFSSFKNHPFNANHCNDYMLESLNFLIYDYFCFLRL